MSADNDDSAVRSRLLELKPAFQRRFARLLGEEDGPALDAAWPVWSHDGQGAPPGDWQTWVIMAGRGFGKTRAGAEWIAAMVRAHQGLRIALVAATVDDARAIMVEGNSGLLTVADGLVDDWQPSLKLLRFTGDNEARLFSGASPGQLRGPEHHIAWCDELAKWARPGDTWDMLQLGLRLGARPRVIVTTTPKTGPVLERIRGQKGCVTTRGKTDANPHVSEAFLETIRDLYEGTRLGRQEIDGELLPPAGALWTVASIEGCRRPSSPAPAGVWPRLSPGPTTTGQTGLGQGPSAGTAAGDTLGTPTPTPALKEEGPTPFTRTLIAVDPPSGDGTCGIIACARDARGHVYVLADHSVTGRSPEGWAAAVGHAAAAHATRDVIAEANQGGRMVKSVLLTADPTLHVRLVHARDGKAERADPVAHLFQAGKAWFAGRFPELEAQLLGLIAGGGYDGPGVSPDRADAMVWGLSVLTKGERVVRVSVV